MDYLRLWAEDAHAQERHTLAHARALRVHSSPKARWLLQPRALPSPKTALNTQAGSSTARHGERAEGLSGEGTDRRVLWTPGGDVPLLPREPSRRLFQPGPAERPRRRHRDRISPSSFFLAKTLTLPLAPPSPVPDGYSGLSTQPALSLGWDACVQTNVHSLVSRRRPQATGTGLMLSCRSHR